MLYMNESCYIYIYNMYCTRFKTYSQALAYGTSCIMTHICVYICTHICVYIYVYILVWPCTVFGLYTRPCKDGVMCNARTYVCVYIYKHIYMNIYMYIYIYIYYLPCTVRSLPTSSCRHDGSTCSS